MASAPLQPVLMIQENVRAGTLSSLPARIRIHASLSGEYLRSATRPSYLGQHTPIGWNFQWPAMRRASRRLHRLTGSSPSAKRPPLHDAEAHDAERGTASVQANGLGCLHLTSALVENRETDPGFELIAARLASPQIANILIVQVLSQDRGNKRSAALRTEVKRRPFASPHGTPSRSKRPPYPTFLTIPRQEWRSRPCMPSHVWPSGRSQSAGTARRPNQPGTEGPNDLRRTAQCAGR
jgi:hypothetical protein